MNDIRRMPQADRQRLLVVNLRIILRLFPRYTPQIRKVIALIHSGAAPHTSLKATLDIFLGRGILNTISTSVKQHFIAAKIKKRTLATDRSCLCHGCFSYPAEIKCPQCGHVTFCYGCYDYGRCDSCTKRNM